MDLPKDTIILPKTHPPMYLFHKYWARKSHNVVRAYIQKYTKPGDVILDPFCGSGVTIAESILANRNAIGIDINPFSIFLTKVTITPVNIDLLKKISNSIIERVTSKISELYSVRCPYCKKPAIITQIIWKNIESNTLQSPNEQIEEIRFECSNCKIKNATIDPLLFPQVYNDESKRVKQLESEYLEKIKKYQISIPKIQLSYKNGAKFKQLRHYLIQNPSADQVFTKRNLLVLGILHSEIINIFTETTSNQELEDIRDVLLASFTANIGQSSKMVWVIKNRKSTPRKKKEVGSWTHHFYWNPIEFFEVNPLIGFETRVKKSIRAQQNLHVRMQENSIETPNLVPDWDTYEKCKGNTLVLIQGTTEDLSLPDESIDYIFADPPYGDSIQYYELSTLWNKWLGFSTELHEENEIIINSRQNKTKTGYFHKLELAFKECYRVLKTDSYMTITFHNTDSSIRNGLIRTLQNVGFQLDSLLFQMPPRNSLKSYLHYEKSPVGDYFLRFKKYNTSKSKAPYPSKNEIVNIIKSTVNNVLLERAEPTNLVFLYNCIDEQLASYGSFPLQESSIIDNSIKAMKTANQITILDKNLVWFSHSETKTFQSRPLTEKIEEFLTKIPSLKKKRYSDIYNMVYENYYGWDTPDRKILAELVDKIKKNQ
jgi:16S rRNA G966 N2-methylase RsmD